MYTQIIGPSDDNGRQWQLAVAQTNQWKQEEGNKFCSTIML